MRVGVDGRSLAGDGRGVAQYLSGMLEAMATAAPDVELRVLTPRSRVLHGAAALVGRPRLDRLLGDVDVVWLPAPAPVAVGRTPFALTLHDLGFLERPGDFTRYERAWHRLARVGPLARRVTSPAASAAAHSACATPSTLGSAATRFGEIAASASAVFVSNVFVTASIPAAAISIAAWLGCGASRSARPTSYRA